MEAYDIRLPEYFAFLGDASVFLFIRVGQKWFQYYHEDQRLESSWIMHSPDYVPLTMSELEPFSPDAQTRIFVEEHPLIAADRLVY